MKYKNYKLLCLQTRELFDDKPDSSGRFLLANPNLDREKATTSFLQSIYSQPLNINEKHINSIFSYSWLPKNFDFPCTSQPITYKSSGLAKYLKLENLYITFSGYNTKLNAKNITGTFKEYEALSVFARQGYDTQTCLVLASAGNTARAFLEIGSQLNARVLIIIPQSALQEIWSCTTQSNNVHVIAIEGDYFDAITIAHTISQYDGFVAEGGAKNIARRDGMGITFLSAVQTMQRIPDHYFQAIGSGCGAISAWEAAQRLLTLGYNNTKMSKSKSTKLGYPQLHLSQNAPFTPIVAAWNKHKKTIKNLNPKISKQQIEKIIAPVLANRNPPYSTIGGLYEALTACEGHTYACSNTQAQEAQNLFTEHEGFDIVPAAQIALASLITAVKNNKVKQSDYIMLNITGGGIQYIQQYLSPKKIHRYHLLNQNFTTADLQQILKDCHLL